MKIIYSIILYIIQPIIWLHIWICGRKNPAYYKRLTERYGYCVGKVQPYGIVLHSVSLGEVIASIPLINSLLNLYPTLPITITTMTPTGSDMIESIFGQTVYHVYLPYDLPSCINRFLKTVKPKLMIIMETELWPNIIHILHKNNIPLIIANARLSEKSMKGYKKVGWFIRKLLNCITLIAVQNIEDRDRFISLGVIHSRLSVIGNLKFDISITPELLNKIFTLRQKWNLNRPVWIASSTHDYEEIIILNVHRRLLQDFPNLLLILVPRHPERFKYVYNLINKNNFSFISRSSGVIPSNLINVIIGDTIGELMLFYGLADFAFIGGSLVKHGGHNPLEPAAHALPILVGPYTWNFKDIYAKLQQANGLIIVKNEITLYEKTFKLLENIEYRHDYGNQAIKILNQNQGALQRLLKLIKPFLFNTNLLTYVTTPLAFCSDNHKK